MIPALVRLGICDLQVFVFSSHSAVAYFVINDTPLACPNVWFHILPQYTFERRIIAFSYYSLSLLSSAPLY